MRRLDNITDSTGQEFEQNVEKWCRSWRAEWSAGYKESWTVSGGITPSAQGSQCRWGPVLSLPPPPDRGAQGCLHFQLLARPRRWQSQAGATHLGACHELVRSGRS